MWSVVDRNVVMRRMTVLGAARITNLEKIKYFISTTLSLLSPLYNLF